MKRKLYFQIVFLFAGIYAIQAQDWGYVNTLQDEWLRKIWTQGMDTVYIVGENGLVARSTDKGETWTKQHFPTGTALNDIFFIDHYTGFAVGEKGTILKTADSGETWKQIPIDFNLTINAIAATGLDNIWAVGDGSLILHSTDSGETWEQENILPENDRQLSDIAFRGSLGYFTGNYATVYKTEEGGVTWNKQTIVDQPNASVNAYSINIMENKTYLMISNNLYSTEDQVNWMISECHDVVLLYRANPFFLNDSVGYVCIGGIPTGSGYGMLSIFKTNNGVNILDEIHLSFNSQQIVIGDIYPSMKMVNDTLGYAISSQVLIKTPAIKKVQENIQEIKNKANVIISQNTRDELTLKLESNLIKSIEIFDASGKCLQKQFSNDNQFQETIDISGIPNGIYLVKVILSDNTVCTKKWIKQ